jgi:ATP-dependent protease HslVU (ClpYQ) peptidase subunit
MYDWIVTTLVGIQTATRVVLAADSQVTEDNLRSIVTSAPKIVEVGRYLLGITGDTRPGDILTYNWKPPAPKYAESPIHFMGRKVIPSIMQTFRDNGYDYAEALKEKDSGFDYLLAFNGNLFHIACDLSFFQSQYGVYGLGTGGQFAMGYLYSVVKPTGIPFTRAEAIARRAIEIASVLDINTSPPIQLVIQEKG